jgi:hypothetical protein
MPKLRMYSDSWGNFSALAQEAISGGTFVKAMSVAAPSATQVPSDILEVCACDGSGDEKVCCGIALDNAASGERVTIATRGLIKTYAVDAQVAGRACMAPAAAIEGVNTLDVVFLGSAVPVGQALHDAVSGEMVFVNLNIGAGH